MIILNYSGNVSKHIQVKESIKRLIDCDAFSYGEKLPPVKELASKLAINPKTLKWAFDSLEKEGYISYKDSEIYVTKKELERKKRGKREE